MEEKMKHLEMIQGIISRMAGNSFALKGWAVTLVAGIFALSAKDANNVFCFLALIPVLVFWGLDSYYLQQERIFRELYNEVRKKENKDIDFSMNIAIFKDEEGKKYEKESLRYWNVVFSTTENWFYFPLAAITIFVCVIAMIF